MNVYVLGYRPRKDEEKLPEPTTKRREFEPPETVVGYCTTPEWVIGAPELADAECRILNGMIVHVGRHYCQFEVEKLDEDKFAIVCKSHPGLTL